MPRWVDECVESARPGLKKRHPKDSPDRVTSRAYAICTAQYNRLVKQGKLKDVEPEITEASCHSLAGDNSRNYAIPRLKALPYRSDSGPNRSCVRAAMARWNQVQGATSAEKTRARNLLIRVGKSLGMKVTWPKA